MLVRRMTGEELNEHCVQPTVRHGGGGIMVWGCINARGVGCISKVEGSLTGEVHIDVLADGLIPSRDMLGLPDGWILQQDNATCHTSRVVKQWLQDEGITSMEWPAQSPDLNPIENLWDYVKSKVQQQNPTNVKELWNAVKTTWLHFPMNNITNLINSMPHGVKQLSKLGEDQQNINMSFYIMLRVIPCCLIIFYDVWLHDLLKFVLINSF